MTYSFRHGHLLSGRLIAADQIRGPDPNTLRLASKVPSNYEIMRFDKLTNAFSLLLLFPMTRTMGGRYYIVLANQ